MSLFDSYVFADRELATVALWEARVLLPVSNLLNPEFGDPAFTPMVLTGGFGVQAGYTVGYRVTNNHVDVDGVITNYTVGNTLYTFPAPLRPPNTRYFATFLSTGGVANWTLNPAGQLILAAKSAGVDAGSFGGLNGIGWEIN